ncbi:MAG: acyltransferase [Massilia sp.]|nr:acyltransferase [Massilia sp.]
MPDALGARFSINFFEAMTPQPLRFHEIDLLRGIACLSVLAFHYLWRGPSTHAMQGIDFPLAQSIASYGYLGVQLFFVISGFVILMSAHGATPRNFFASRVARLYPALWVAASLTAGTAWFLRDAHFSVSFYDYLINLTMLAHWFDTPFVDGAYWSLGYELHFYIFVWLAMRFGLMARIQWLLAAWLLISAINAIRPMWPIELWLNARWAPFFVAGGVFYLIRTSGVTLARLGLLTVSFSLALIYTAAHEQTHTSATGPGLMPSPVVALILTCIFVTFWLIATCRLHMKASALTYYAGALTYPVYLLHQNFGFMLFGQLSSAWDNVLVAMLSTLTVVLVISWAINAVIERPLGRLIRRAISAPALANLQPNLRSDRL